MSTAAATAVSARGSAAVTTSKPASVSAAGEIAGVSTACKPACVSALESGVPARESAAARRS